MKNRSHLLINEPPLLVQPTLARAIGLNEAMALQQIHFLLNSPRMGVQREGHKWIYNTYEEWRAETFPFWSEITIKRTLVALERLGLLITAQFDKGGWNRRKYYRIDYTKLEEMLNRIDQENDAASPSPDTPPDDGDRDDSDDDENNPPPAPIPPNDNAPAASSASTPDRGSDPIDGINLIPSMGSNRYDQSDQIDPVDGINLIPSERINLIRSYHRKRSYREDPPPPPRPSQHHAQNGGGGGGGDVQNQKNDFPPPPGSDRPDPAPQSGAPPQKIPNLPSAHEQLCAIGFQAAHATNLLAAIANRPDADLVAARIIECARIEHQAGLLRSLTGVVHYRLSRFDASAPPETPETVLAAIDAAFASAHPPGREDRLRRRQQVSCASPAVNAIRNWQYQRAAEQRPALRKAAQESPREQQQRARLEAERQAREEKEKQAWASLEAHWYEIGASLWYTANRVPLRQRLGCAEADARQWFDLSIAYRRANGLGPDARVTVQELQHWQLAALGTNS